MTEPQIANLRTAQRCPPPEPGQLSRESRSLPVFLIGASCLAHLSPEAHLRQLGAGRIGRYGALSQTASPELRRNACEQIYSASEEMARAVGSRRAPRRLRISARRVG